MFSNFFDLVNCKKSIWLVSAYFFVFGICTSASTLNETLPLKKTEWNVLSYNKMLSNRVEDNDKGLSIYVNKSAGPVVYKLDKPKIVSGFLVKAVFSGNKELESGDFDEDSILRFGLVATGKNTLSALKKLLAADWIKKLFALAPEGTGLDKIYFYNITNRKEVLNKSRSHPKSDFILENISKHVEKEGPFDMNITLAAPLEVAAIWISTDGDDTKSNFTINISEIQLKLEVP